MRRIENFLMSWLIILDKNTKPIDFAGIYRKFTNLQEYSK